MEDLKRKMRNRKEGVKLSNKSGLLKTYRSCFSASDAVTFVQAEMRLGCRDDALAMLRELVNEGFIILANAKGELKDDSGQLLQFAQKKTVVVVGGGMAGTTVARNLHKKFRVVLVDGRGFFQNTPSLPYVICDPSHYRKISFSLQEVFGDKVEVITQNCVEVRPESKHVVLSGGDTLAYDYLVLSSGSRYEPPPPLRSIPEGSQVKLINPMSSDAILQVYNQLIALDNIVVVGGGPTGIEITGEIAAAFPKKKISVISSRDRLLERCCQEAHEGAFKTLSQFPNLTFYLGEKLDHVTQDSIVTDKGTNIPCSICFFAVGFTPNTEYMLPHCAASMDGAQVKVDKHLMVEGLEDVFALGDITNVDEEKLAQNADKHGETVSQTIQALELRQPPVEYQPAVRYLIISLGPKRAMIVKGDSVVTEGMLASKLKSIIELKVMHFHQ